MRSPSPPHPARGAAVKVLVAQLGVVVAGVAAVVGARAQLVRAAEATYARGALGLRVSERGRGKGGGGW